MNLETLYLFAALAVLAALGIWLNIKAGDVPVAMLSALMVLAGVAGMVTLIGASLFGWNLAGGSL